MRPMPLKKMPEPLNHIKEYVQRSSRLPREVGFSTLEELLLVPWVAALTREKGFFRLSMNGFTLMAEFSRGRSWKVVGFLRDEVPGLEQRG
jgi:hypothetical protein